MKEIRTSLQVIIKRPGRNPCCSLFIVKRRVNKVKDNNFKRLKKLREDGNKTIVRKKNVGSPDVNIGVMEPILRAMGNTLEY